ncbi:MAG: sodium/proline symporter [Armatimonadota bacterium]
MTLDAKAVAFGAYFLVILAIGVWATRFSSRGVSEYFIGGRSVPRFVVALSAVVSGRSAWVFTGLAGLAYRDGASAVWYVVGFTIAEMLLFFFFANRVRRFGEARDCVTVTDILAARLGDHAGRLRVAVAVPIVIFYTAYVAAQFDAGGKALAQNYGVEGHTAIIVTAGIILFYTFLGGFLAVSYTDAIQAVFMISALVLLPLLLIPAEGGWSAVMQSLNPGALDPMKISIGMMIGGLGLGLGSGGNPHIVARYLSIRHVDGLRFAGVIGTLWNVVMCWCAILIGISGQAVFRGETTLATKQASETVLLQLTQTFLPPLMAGFVLAALFAAIMSTADSQLLVVASSIVRDLIQRVIFKGTELSQRLLVVLSRLVVLGVTVGAVAVAWRGAESLHALIVLAWSGVGGSLGPPLILCSFWRRLTTAGAIAGILTGTVTVLYWGTNPSLTSITSEIVPGFGASLVATILFSLLTKPPADADESLAIMRGNEPLPSTPPQPSP